MKALEKISWNNKAWSTKRSDNGRNTFVVKATNNQPTDEIWKKVDQIRNELGLVLENVSCG